MNNNLHTIFDCLYELLPTAGVYTAKMQSVLETAWKDRGLPNLSSVLIRLMQDKEPLTEENKYEMEYLLDYLSMTTYTTLTGKTGWNAKTTVVENLAHEHSPDVYVAWMFSTDDPARLLSDSMEYARVSYTGHVRISVIGENGFYLTVNEDGSTSDWSDKEEFTSNAPPIAQRPEIAVERKETQTILTLPKDQIFVLVLDALRTETLSYFAAGYQVGRMQGDLSKVCFCEMTEGEMYTAIAYNSAIDADDEESKAIYGDSTFAFEPWSEDLPYSTALLSQLENQNVFHLTWTQLSWIIGGFILLVLVLLTVLIVILVKRRRRKKNTASI